MAIQDKIKEKVLQEIYSKIDEAYDLVHRRFDVSSEEDAGLIRRLNEAKDTLHALAQKSALV